MMHLNERPAPELIQTAYTREIADTAILYEGMSLADLAHVVMLTETEIIPQKPGGMLLHALLSIHPKPPIDFALDPATGDLYANREAHLAMKTPFVGYLSTGRARREAVTIAYRIATRTRLLKLADALAKCSTTIAEVAGDHIDTLFPDYTYLQIAQPTTFGHYILSFAYPVLRDIDRLMEVFSRTNISPAGSGSVNGSRLPLNRERLAELLGFNGIISHTRDAMWQADGPIEITALLTSVLINMNRLAEDLQIYATQEFGLIELSDRHSRPSKIMPQKKNPYSLTYIRGVAGETLGTLASMAAIGKTSTGQPDNRIFAHGSVPRSLDQTIGVVSLMSGVLGGVTVNSSRAAERAGASYSWATDLAEVLMLKEGIDYRTAYKIIAQLVHTTRNQRIDPQIINLEEINCAAKQVIGREFEIQEEDLNDIMDPNVIVASRTGLGGASKSSVESMLNEIRATISEVKQWCKEKRTHLNETDAKLRSKAAELANSPNPEPSTNDRSEKTMGDLLNEVPERSWRNRRW